MKFPTEHLPQDLIESLPDIVVDRRGLSDNAFMTTLSVPGFIQPGKAYTLDNQGLTQSGEAQTPPSKEPCLDVKPPSIIISGDWQSFEGGDATDGNILGGNGSFLQDDRTFSIPEAEANQENLAYYGAHRLSFGESLCFEATADLPITTMEVGATYVPDYLRHENLGGGVYIEVHDRPHFHMPLDDQAKGHLVLGRKHTEGVELTAFRIPYGTGVYTSPWIVHCDAFLIGHYAVVYSLTPHFSTVIVKDRDGHAIPVSVETK